MLNWLTNCGPKRPSGKHLRSAVVCGQRAISQACGAMETLERRVLLSGDLFVANSGSGTIGQYTATGTPVNASLISGLKSPVGIAISGTDLFVTSTDSGGNTGTISEYTTSGATVKAPLVSGLTDPTAIAVSGTDLFVVNGNTIGEYATSGTTIKAPLISGLSKPTAIAVSGTDLFVVNGSVIGEYTTSGTTVNASLISGLKSPVGLAVSGSDLFVTSTNTGGTAGTISEYTTSGATVKAPLVSGLSSPTGIVVSGTDLFVASKGAGTTTGTIGKYTTSGATTSASLVSGLSSPEGLALETLVATKLAFHQQPSAVAAGSAITPAVTVDVEDQNGNVLTSDTSSVTLALTSPPAGATLGGTTTVAAVNGVATFSNLSVNVPGTYTLTATDTADKLTSVTSSSFVVSPVAPTITSTSHKKFTVGTADSFTFTTTGAPAATLTETGALPTGVTFVNNGNGTATLSGTPAQGTGGSYPLTIKAKNGTTPNAHQSFTLRVVKAPTITSADTTTFRVGTAGKFLIHTTGFPVATITETGTLPAGVTFKDKGNGEARLAGTPAAGTARSYVLTIKAKNGNTPNATQTFTLVVAAATPTVVAPTLENLLQEAGTALPGTGNDTLFGSAG